MKTLLLRIGLVLSLLVTPEVRSAAQTTEELARRQYESGLAFVQSGRYTEALKDFQAVVQSFPASTSADDALLQIALYQLDVLRNPGAAQTTADRLISGYAASDSAPMAYVVLGRLATAKNRTPAEVETALASFERVTRLYPASEAVAAARFHAGDTLRLVRRTGDALQHFQQVSLEYPQSIWAARADLATTAHLVAADRATEAFGRLQHIRHQFPGSPEAAAAINFSSIIYRLYVRKPAPFAFSGRTIGGGQQDRFRDVVGVVVDRGGRVLLGHKEGVAIFDEKGSISRRVTSADMSSFLMDGADRVVVARGSYLVPEGAPAVGIQVPEPGKPPRLLEEIPAVARLSGGDRLIADRKGKKVVRVSPVGDFIGNFAAVNADRLARSESDDIAVVDRETKGVVIFDREGKTLGTLPAKGTNYQIEEPADLAYDALGHLYVLDRRRAAVFVFGAKNRLLATIGSTGRDTGFQRPRAIAVDAAGRLYVFDENSQRIQVYQ